MTPFPTLVANNKAVYCCGAKQRQQMRPWLNRPGEGIGDRPWRLCLIVALTWEREGALCETILAVALGRDGDGDGFFVDVQTDVMHCFVRGCLVSFNGYQGPSFRPGR
jgi:hypothetical protein